MKKIQLIHTHKNKIYIISIVLFIGSLYFIQKYTDNISYLGAQLSLLLVNPRFWRKAFQYLFGKIVRTLFSETFRQTLFNMFDTHIHKPINHTKKVLFSWYQSLGITSKIIVWFFIILFGFILIVILLRSPLLIKLFWQKILDLIAGKSVKSLLNPYIQTLVLTLSNLMLYRCIRIYLIKKIARPIQKRFSKKSSNFSN